MGSRSIRLIALVALVTTSGGCCTPGLYHAAFDEPARSASIVSIEVDADAALRPIAHACVQVEDGHGSRTIELEAPATGAQPPDGRALWLDLPPIVVDGDSTIVCAGEQGRRARAGGVVSPKAEPITLADLRFAPLVRLRMADQSVSLLVDVPPPGGREVDAGAKKPKVDWRPQLFAALDVGRSSGERALRSLGFLVVAPATVAIDVVTVGAAAIVILPLLPFLLASFHGFC